MLWRTQVYAVENARLAVPVGNLSLEKMKGAGAACDQ